MDTWASLVAQLVKNPPTMRETWVPCLSWEYPLEKGKATHSSILSRRIYSPWGCKESHATERLSLFHMQMNLGCREKETPKQHMESILFHGSFASWMWWWLYNYMLCQNSKNCTLNG